MSWCPDEKAEVKSLVIDIHLTHSNVAIHTRFAVIPEPETPSRPLNTYAQGSLDSCLSKLCAWTRLQGQMVLKGILGLSYSRPIGGTLTLSDSSQTGAEKATR